MDTHARTGKLLADYDRMARAVRLRLLDRYHPKHIWEIAVETRRKFAALIPAIPHLGENHVWQFNLDTSAVALALYRTMRRWSFSPTEAVQMIYDAFVAYVQSLALPLRLAYRWYYFTPLHQNRLRHGAAASQVRRHPADWVFTYVEGDSRAFDAGVDIAECAIVKFYRAQGAAELTPYLCALDHAMGKLLGLGFTRTGTLAEGAAVCDCRWKRGAETPGWPPVFVSPATLCQPGGVSIL